MRRAFLVAMLVALVVGAGTVRAQGQPKTPVLILAAASTTNAMDEIRKQFSQDTGIEVLASYASSSTLAQQIVNGADADVFLSADQKWADFLQKKGIVAQRRNLLGNRLVVVVPKDSSLNVSKLEDLTVPGVEHLALGDPQGVPAGRYAKQALTKLGIWDKLKDKVVPAEDVRHALAFVETASAQAGIVYSTDAAISTKVKVAAEVPAGLTEPIQYPAALLAHGKGNAGAESLYRYLASPAAAKVFRKYGFSVLAETRPEPAK